MSVKEYQKIARVGDRIQSNGDGSYGDLVVSFSGRVIFVGRRVFTVKRDDGVRGGGNTGGWRVGWNMPGTLKVLENKGTSMSLKSLVKRAFMSEPARSFLKAGITDECGDLTSEGQAAFINWLLEHHGGDFKKEVVDAILAELKDKK